VSSFAPSIDDARRQGTRVLRTPYPAGVAGVKLSLEQIAQRIREGALSTAVQGAAFDALLKAGFNGRGASAGSARERASVLLDFVRATTLYAPDPPGVEYVKSAEALLCIRPDLCVRGGDCDDQLVLLGSMIMGIGIPVQVLKQTFGPMDQEHVLLEAMDDNGVWFPLDPSGDMPAGRKVQATEEYRLDPSNPSMIGLHGAPDAEFIGVGRMPGHLTRYLGDIPAATPAVAWTPAEIALGILAVGVGVGLIAGVAKRYRKPRRRSRK
jgi:transglutaminase-like putative cysteine protease